jgi:transposase-like protein
MRIQTAALNVMNVGRETIKIRWSKKYLNNLVEKDHRAIRRRIRLMVGSKFVALASSCATSRSCIRSPGSCLNLFWHGELSNGQITDGSQLDDPRREGYAEVATGL